MANLVGINVTDTVRPKTDVDTFPTFLANEGKGGWYSTSSISGRDAIPNSRREEGMVCYVSGSGSYQLVGGVSNSNWTVFNSSTGSSNINTASFVVTSSGANNNLTASYALTSSISDSSISSSYSLTSSYSLNSQNVNTGSFVITASGALTNETSSYALTSSYYLPLSHSYVTKIGNNIDSVYTIFHNLGTKNLTYSMFDVSSSNAVIPDIFFINNNQIRLEFGEVIYTDRYELTLTPGNNLVNYNIGSGSSVETSSYLNGFSGSGSLSNTAGAIDLFLNINLNGVDYKIALHTV